ncbi:MAG: Nramp family divalent metal transporter [Gemmataceae bacterium]
MGWFRRFGPGLLVAAAFIGPGTITTATIAGSSTQFALLWAIVFSVVATFVLQEMAARLGLVTREGLGEALRTTFPNPIVSACCVGLVIVAIGFGNAAYQFGNITGAALGLQAIFGGELWLWSLVVGGAAFALLALGSYKILERILIALVVTMSLVFLITAIISQPDLMAIGRGLVFVSIPPGSLLKVVALIGTTVVPYNLFLHASAVSEKWPKSTHVDKALTEARADTAGAVTLGGLVTMAVVATAAAAFYGKNQNIDNAVEMAKQLGPLLGGLAQTFFAVGLFSAGVTSAITAPLAGAYATAGALGWKHLGENRQPLKFHLVWIIILVTGTLFASMSWKPTQGILLAQAANGLLLPIVAGFLIVVVNRRDLMGHHRNGLLGNVLGAVVVMVAAGLGLFSLWKVVRELVG